MSDKQSSWTLTDLVVPILASVLSVYYLTTIDGIPFIAQMYGGGLSIVVLALSLIVSLVVGVKVFITKSIDYSHTREKARAWVKKYRKAMILVGLIIAFILTVRFLGYPIVSILFVSAAMYVLGFTEDKKKLLLTGLLITVIGFLLFIVFLQVRLPLDPLSRMVSNAIRGLF